MDLILYLIILAITGLLVGALARLALPGRDPLSLLQTMLVGIAGSLLAGILVRVVFDEDGAGILLSVLVTTGIVCFAHTNGNESEISAATVRDGYAAPSTTVLRGRTVLRLCTINPRTTFEEIEATIERMERFTGD